MGGGPGTPRPGSDQLLRRSHAAASDPAYGVKPYQVAGLLPWMDNERFDIVAKVPPGTTVAPFNVMLQSLLAERFNVVVHQGKLPCRARRDPVPIRRKRLGAHCLEVVPLGMPSIGQGIVGEPLKAHWLSVYHQHLGYVARPPGSPHLLALK